MHIHTLTHKQTTQCCPVIINPSFQLDRKMNECWSTSINLIDPKNYGSDTNINRFDYLYITSFDLLDMHHNRIGSVTIYLRN